MSPKDAAFHALGRTIVNFQRLEHNLKILASLAPLEGYTDTIEAQLEQQREKAAKLTLGAAISSWVDVLDGKVKQPKHMNDLYSPTIRRRMTFNLDPEVQEAHAKGLKTLLDERNTLIHGGLACFPWESEADCAELTSYLDSLNASIAEHMQFLEPIANSLRELENGTLIIEQGDSPRHFVTYMVPESDA